MAGIDCDTGCWVRPVPPRGGAIPEDRIWLNNRPIALLDIVEMALDAPTFATRFQCENRAVRNWNWRRVGRAHVADVLHYKTAAGLLLHSRGKVVEPSQMAALAPERWTSLALVHATKVAFEPEPYKESRWQARFSMEQLGAEYCISVTDPETTQRLNTGDQIESECLLTASLTEPIEIKKHNKPELCYKLVAGVIELDAGG